MTRVKTFNPKVPRLVRNNQDRKSPLTQNLTRHGDFLIQEVPSEDQIKKLKASIEKNNGQIKRLIQQKNREPSNAQKIEAKISRIEALVNWKLFLVGMKHKNVVSQQKREQTAKDNLRAEMQAHIANLDKIKPKYNPKSAITPTHQGNIEDVFGRQKPEVKRVGNTTKLKRMKTWSKK